MSLGRPNSLVEVWLDEANSQLLEIFSFSDENISEDISTEKNDYNQFQILLKKYDLPEDAAFSLYQQILPFTQIAIKYEDNLGNKNTDEIAKFYAAIFSIFFRKENQIIEYLKDYEKNYPDNKAILSKAATALLMESPDAFIENNEILEKGLEYAAAQKKWKSIQWLVKLKGKVNLKFGNEEETVLHYAARNLRLENVRWLVKQGADINALGKHGTSVQHQAAAGGNLEVLKWLADQGANMEIKTDLDSTPLHYALRHNQNAVAYWLVQNQHVDVNVANVDANTPLHTAALEGNAEIIQILLQHGADPCKKNVAGLTPLQCAERRYRWEVVKCLLPLEPNKNLTDNNGKAILHYAAENASEEILKWIVEQGADINIKDNFSATPLLYAIKKGRWKEAKMLINECSAKVDCKDKNGISPLSYLQSPVSFFFTPPSNDMINLLQEKTISEQNSLRASPL